ncbi:LOW QUALITY PROTEIN: non-specific phospholipase C3-like [Carica papaya]|uniref:LOW QUALITY PROTEIN: non-specific phospholipase C3-like n=1 Tax=Carica papaya TaxID=3649 RepID=UPI000B8CB6F9|nr:LOW QUALITY PROTEIN: non-specific phospholipase C3-like [Carica papaya]
MEADAGTPSSSFPIKTVVVLIQENRSFDHMLGWFKSLNPEIDGVDGSESNPLSTSDPDSARIPFRDNSDYLDPDPGHSFEAIYEQVFGKPWSPDPNPEVTMEGFVQNAESIQQGMGEKVVMNGFRPEALPVFKDLVTEFGVCDRWFSSLPSLTQPNRLFVHSATSHGAISNDTKKLIEGFPQKTVFESMEESGFSFGIYYQSFPNVLFYRSMRKLKYIDNFHHYDLSFKRHCREGKLPNYTVIEPRYFNMLSAKANDDHPKNNVMEGQKLVKEIYEALRSSPQWNEILFLVIYDEHGGYYDHVPTPVDGVPNPDDLIGPEPSNFKFDRLGVRVPVLLISPWIDPGTVVHGPPGPEQMSQFEHSSIPATLKKIFNLKEFLTKRDAWAGTFDIVINRTTPREDCPEILSEPILTRDFEVEEDETLTDFQEELIQAAAALTGEHVKDIYPFKLVENMKASHGAKYVEDAFNKFLRESKKAKDDGADEHEIVSLLTQPTRTTFPKTFLQKVFSCLVCDN